MHKMLIVDDDWLISDSIKHMDEWLDLHIDVVGTAENGKEALFWLQNESIDIILTDIRMPELDGLKLTQHIHNEKINTNVIIMSGYEEFSYAQQAIRFNARGYILKPIDTDELLQIVKKVQVEFLSSNHQSIISQNKENHKIQSEQERIITATLNYIHSNYMEPLTLRELADRVHLSDHYLGQLFKNITGKTFLRYLTQVRMENAVRFLTNPILKVYEISEMVGYTDPKHFMKVFKRTYKCTPREYRKKKISMDN